VVPRIFHEIIEKEMEGRQMTGMSAARKEELSMDSIYIDN
jgi:hypothetical protein